MPEPDVTVEPVVVVANLSVLELLCIVLTAGSLSSCLG
jgi:hypothetical protein